MIGFFWRLGNRLFWEKAQCYRCTRLIHRKSVRICLVMLMDQVTPISQWLNQTTVPSHSHSVSNQSWLWNSIHPGLSGTQAHRGPISTSAHIITGAGKRPEKIICWILELPPRRGRYNICSHFVGQITSQGHN